MAPRKKKPKEQTKLWQKRQASIERTRVKKLTKQRHREIAQQANKQAVRDMAEEVFGEGGLTIARQEALAAVVIGPGAKAFEPTNVYQLKVFINKARKKFAAHAEQYADIHLHSTAAALSAGEFDVAARHAEWALESQGDTEDRVVTKAPRVEAAPTAAAIMVGVPLGGRIHRQE